VLGVDDLHRLVGSDVGGGHDAALVAVDADGAGLLAGVLDHQALDVEDDVRDVLDDAGDGGDLVLDALDLDAGGGAALQTGQQDAAQAVADGDAEAALEGFDGELAVGVRKGIAVTGNAVGQFQATPLDAHGSMTSPKRRRRWVEGAGRGPTGWPRAPAPPPAHRGGGATPRGMSRCG